MLEYYFISIEYLVSFYKNFCIGKVFIRIVLLIKKVIFEKVKGSKGFFSIFDEFVESIGGILYCNVMVDMLRDLK